MEGVHSISRGRRWAIASALIIVIGSIGPWVDVGGESAGGLDKDGAVTIALALIAAAYLIFTPLPHWAPTAVIGALAATVAIFDIIDIEDLSGLVGGFASPGWGLYLTAIGSIGLIASTVFAMRTGDEGHAPLSLVGKLILGVAALLVVLFIIWLLGSEEVAKAPVLEPVEISL